MNAFHRDTALVFINGWEVKKPPSLQKQRRGLIGFRRRPTLPGRYQPSTIGAKRLNCCVRNGNRCDPLAIATGNCMLL